MTRCGLFFGVLFAVFTACMTSAQAWDELDVSAELRRPGVKLVVVEFYADWCTGCQKAVPQWDKLHKKYRDWGLRLIVVSVGEGGSCSPPGWNPDKIVCDFDSSIQDQFGVSKLPEAFLFSWQGNLLASHAHIEQIVPIVKMYFRQAPRIYVSAPSDENGRKVKKGKALQEMVRSELRESAKFDLVADELDKQELRRIKKASHNMNYADTSQCELGKEVSANSELKIKVLTFGKEKTLVLQLYSIEEGCMTASAKARVGARGLQGAVVEAVRVLVESLVGKSNLPKSAPAVVPVAQGGASAGGSAPTQVAAAPAVSEYEKMRLEMKKAPKMKMEDSEEAPAFDGLRTESQAPSEYERMWQEKKQREQEKMEYSRSLYQAWQIVYPLSQDESLSVAKRKSIMRKFLADFPENNPYKETAEKIILDMESGTLQVMMRPEKTTLFANDEELDLDKMDWEWMRTEKNEQRYGFYHQLKAGSYQLRFEHPGFVKQEKSIGLAPLEELKLEVDMEVVPKNKAIVEEMSEVVDTDLTYTEYAAYAKSDDSEKIDFDEYLLGEYKKYKKSNEIAVGVGFGLFAVGGTMVTLGFMGVGGDSVWNLLLYSIGGGLATTVIMGSISAAHLSRINKRLDKLEAYQEQHYEMVPAQ